MNLPWSPFRRIRGERRRSLPSAWKQKNVGKNPRQYRGYQTHEGGVIADFDITEAMFETFHTSLFTIAGPGPPRIIVSIPSGITQVERRAVRETVESAGAREMYFHREPMAAAIGAGLPIMEPTSSMVVDIGGGTTEVAVISLAGIVYSKICQVAGDRMDEEIVQYMKRKFNLLIGDDRRRS